MPHRISIQPNNRVFTAAGDRTVLDAALAAGLSLPFGCRSGFCGVCKGKVVSGRTAPGAQAEHALSENERAAGYALLCCVHPDSDLQLEMDGQAVADDFPVKSFSARVRRLERLADDIMLIELQLPASEPVGFRAGQYIDIVLPDGARRSFSIANAPHREGMMELHVRRIAGGRFTPGVFSTLKVRDILRCEGPLGNFWLREDSARPILMIATGTGFAPLKGIIEHAIHIGLTRPITLYWGARAPAGLYLDALARCWGEDLANFHYVPVVSGNAPDWNGRRGRIPAAVLADFEDLSACEVYACGLPAMIETARERFTHEGKLPRDAFHADAFTFSVPSSPTPAKD
jgi:CDP-4-dehydro-6-deoxyglucose reductase